MSDKFLSESEWKKFAKGRDLKDDALVKGLAALDRAKTPEQELAALAEIGKQSALLRKSAKGDKELGAYLDGLDKAADKQRRLGEAEAAKAEQEQGGDEEEESPALLTTRMVPLLRQIRKGEEMQVLLASTGKDVAVLLSRRAIAPTRRKLLAEYLDAGAAKYFSGTCIFEQNAYTFVLRTQAAGLAKKVKAALFKQVELRLKVRVRGEDPDDIDDDGDPAEDETAEVETEAGDTAPVDPLQAQFAKRWETLEAQALAALRAGTGEVSKIRAVADFVRDKAEAGNYKAAVQAMETLAKLLATPGTAGQGSAKQDSKELETALENWRGARDVAVGKLRALVKEIADAKLPEAREAIIEASAVLKQLTAEPRTAQQVKELSRWLQDDDVVDDVCEVVEDIRSPLLDALQGLERAIAA